jgi:insertion element IS1 protein InsB
VDRANGCIVGWDVVTQRSTSVMQRWLNHTPAARRYFSDDFPTYGTLDYRPGRHFVAPGKTQTYTVESDNANLRHYLARLARKSRCFSRCIQALRRAIHLFVHCYNLQQLHRTAYQDRHFHLTDFI